MFFSPVRASTFFDTQRRADPGDEGLLYCYTMRPPDGTQLWFEACDLAGHAERVEITDLRLFLFANGMGIFSVGVEGVSVAIDNVLWINESLRKVYPSSGQQVREGRMPSKFTWALEQNGQRTLLIQDTETARHAK
jgi:hypothetical protein